MKAEVDVFRPERKDFRMKPGLRECFLSLVWFAAFFVFFDHDTVLAAASDPTAPLPMISIVIDDLGERLDAGQRVVSLEGPVACAFFAGAAYTDRLARLAHHASKEVMLHLPMQTHSPEWEPLPTSLSMDMLQTELLESVEKQLAAIPYVVGVNNHQGSLLTRHPGHMEWLMAALAQKGLFYVDSRTTAQTVAEMIANENQVRVMRRHVFLDHDISSQQIAFQFERLIKLAKQHGYALAIGHPYPETLALLEQVLPELEYWGVKLVSVETLITRATNQGVWTADQ
jgi:polysaccharide deacetylase 2 family uncharacterized protein YibQ